MSIPDIPILYWVVRFGPCVIGRVLTPFLYVSVLNRKLLGCSSNPISNLWSLTSSSRIYPLMRQGRSCGSPIPWITWGFLSVSPFFFYTFFFYTSHSSYDLEASKANSFLCSPFLDEHESYSTPVSAATTFLFSLVSNRTKTTFLPILGIINTVLRSCVVWNVYHTSSLSKSNYSLTMN